MTGHASLDEALDARPESMVSLAPEHWSLLERANRGGAHRLDFFTAFSNGQAFLRADNGLRNRLPISIEWKGSQRAPGDEGDGRLQAHQGAKGRCRQPAQGVHFQAERDDRQQQGQPEACQEQMRCQDRDDGRPGHQSRRQRRHRDGHGQALQACHLVPDRLGEHDVAGPADRRAQRAGDARWAGAALPRVGQKQHAGRGEARPQQRAAAAAAGDGHAERAEELKGAGRAERQPGHGRHEQHGHPGRHDAEGDRGQQHRAAKAPGPGPDGGQQDHGRPGQPEPDGAQRADLTEEVDGQRQAELDAAHRAQRHHGARTG